MSIYTCDLIDASSSINAQFDIDTIRVYRVVSDVLDDEIFVRTHWGNSLSPPLFLFAGHPSESVALLKNVLAKMTGEKVTCADNQARRVWSVTATFGILNDKEIFQTAASGDPTDAQIEVSIEGVFEEKICDQDVNGDPVVTSAGAPYDPPVMKDDVRCIIKINRNEKDLVPIQVFAAANCVNLNAWQGLAPGTCRFMAPRITPKYSSQLNVLYYKNEYTIAYNPDGWQINQLDAGYQYWDSVAMKKRNIVDASGSSVTSPELLDGHGNVLDKNIFAEGVAFWNQQDRYETYDFDQFNFPENIFVTVPFL